MRRGSAFLLLPAAAVTFVLVASAPTTRTAHGASSGRPVILAAGPTVEPGDVVSNGFYRVTFSPDGDGRADKVTISVQAKAGDSLTLWVRPLGRTAVYLPTRTAVSGTTTIRWDGLQPGGMRYPTGSYVLAVCDRVTHLCSSDRVLAHLRVLTLYVRNDTAVSAGQTVHVNLDTDRLGPYTLDLVSAADPTGPGIGAVAVQEPGWFDYRIPAVPAGGLWVLRLRSGSHVTHYPLVVHEPSIQLDAPPPHTALVVYPYLTWRAYDMADQNRDGVIDSWYSHPSNPVVPLYGPFEPAATGPVLEGREPNPDSQDAFAAWMQQHKLTAEHVTDVELASLPAYVLQRYATIVFEGHTEYYEQTEYDKVLAYRNAGGRLYFFQGNPFYGQAQIVGDHIWRRSYRYRSLAQSDFAIAGVGFRECCWPTWIVPQYRLAAGAVERLPWAFAGTGLKDGDPFGFADGEVDTIDPLLSPPGTFAVATATVPPFQPTSRDEPPAAWIGAKSFPYQPAWLKPRQIVIAYAEVRKGAIFSWANTGFLKTVVYGDLGLPATQREQLDRVALNVWERFTQ
jgi:N,N-dimethylformamidase beta subunit-like, C-terminal